MTEMQELSDYFQTVLKEKKAELAKVKKQLAIAVEGLMTITDNGDSLWDIQQAQWYLEKIKELNK